MRDEELCKLKIIKEYFINPNLSTEDLVELA